MKKTYYFSHDYNARTDVKTKALIMELGMEGYGLYWCLIEDLYNNNNQLPLNVKGIAYDLRTSIGKIEKVLNDFELFIISNNIISNESVGKRLKIRDDKSEKGRVSALKRWDKKKGVKKVQELKPKNKQIKEPMYRVFNHLSLSVKDFEKLKEKYTQVQIDNVLDNISNFAQNKKYKSLYITANNWLKKDVGSNKSANDRLRQSIGL